MKKKLQRRLLVILSLLLAALLSQVAHAASDTFNNGPVPARKIDGLSQTDVTVTQATGADLDGWLWNPDTDHYYHYFAEWQIGDWQVAEAHAIALGGHLVTINNAAEEQWLCNVLVIPIDPNHVYDPLGTWTGFNNIAQYDNWVWASGEPATYTNWLPGNPGNVWGIPTHAAALRYCGSSIMGWAELRSDGKSGDYWGHDYIVEKNTGPIGEVLSGNAIVDGQSIATGSLVMQGQTLKTANNSTVVIDAGNPQPPRGGVWRPQYFEVQHEIQANTEVTFPKKMEVQVSSGTLKTTANTWSDANTRTNPPVTIRTVDGVATLDKAQVLTIVAEGNTTFVLLDGDGMSVSTGDPLTTQTISSPCTAVDVANGIISAPYPYCSLHLDVAPLYQTDPRWGGDIYGSTTYTIAKKGCALTSLSMALNYAGIANDPKALNSFMKLHQGYDSSGNVGWEETTTQISNNQQSFWFIKSSSVDVLDNLLLQGYPVIVGVKGGKHFVLVTGRSGSTFQIIDPGHQDITTLDAYGNQFETRGVIKRKNATITPINMGSALPDENSGVLIVSVNKQSLLTTNANGQQVGLDPSTGTVVEEIPGSMYFLDALEDDETLEPSDNPVSYAVIPQPAPGEYQVSVVGTESAPYSLTVSAFSQDGSFQGSQYFSGYATPGTTYSYDIGYIADPFFLFLPIILR